MFVRRSQNGRKVKKEKRGIFKRIGGFFKEVRIETFKRIIWPTPKQVLNNTLIVIVTVLVVGIFVWLLDFLFVNGLDFALNTLPDLF